MSVKAPPARHDVVWLDLGFGSYELGADECHQLIRFLSHRAGRPGARAELACARRLEALLDEDSLGRGALSERQLDAVADAAWDWLQRVGSDALPERVLCFLDAVCARHGHE